METKLIQQEAEKLERQLKLDGHNCIQIMETYPMQVNWCGQKPCKYKIIDNPSKSSCFIF